MRLAGIILALVLLLAGCSTVSRTWTDFRAYYNSYYNAHQEFRAGREALPEHDNRFEGGWIQLFPVRKATQAEPFEKALTKTEAVLRKFPDTKWSDDARYLRARSYYYLDRLYSALQSFEEMAERPEGSFRQEAVIWKARVLYEMDRDSLNRVFLQRELDRLESGGARNYRAEAKALLAQSHVRAGDLGEARSLLGEATSELPSGDLRARTSFLFGQVLEQSGSWVEAYFAYTNVSQGFPAPVYLFLSGVKKAEMARRMDRTEESSEILLQLLRDDKFYGYRHFIRVEQAKTAEATGKATQAEDIYLDLLRTVEEEGAGEHPGVRTDAYYRLGSLYGRQKGNYMKAAAYYDSASGLPDSDFSAILDPSRDRTTDGTYRAYAEMRLRMQQLDSLLQLGSLPAREREAILQEERNRRLEALRESQVRQSDRLYHAGLPGEGAQGGNSALFGFLNHRNASQREESRAQFQAYWGERPLRDHWRRQGGTESRQAAIPQEEEEETGLEEDAQPVIDLNREAIPITPEARAQVRNKLAEISLSLGHHFRFSMEMPDSAAVYYQYTADRYPDSPSAPLGLYSLERLYLARGDTAPARSVRQEARNRYGGEASDPAAGRTDEASASLEDSLRLAADSILQEDGRTARENARHLRQLAMEHPGSAVSPAIFMRAIHLLVREARTVDDGGSVSTGRDTLGRIEDGGPAYQGAHWDRVRRDLQTFMEEFGEHSMAGRAEAMLAELQKEPSPEQQPAYRSCESLGSELVLRDGVEAFMKHVRMPDSLQGMRLEGSVSYRFKVDRQGTPLSWELVGSSTELGLEEALTRAFADHLRFLPVLVRGEAVPAQCTYSFPISPR